MTPPTPPQSHSASTPGYSECPVVPAVGQATLLYPRKSSLSCFVLAHGRIPWSAVWQGLALCPVYQCAERAQAPLHQLECSLGRNLKACGVAFEPEHLCKTHRHLVLNLQGPLDLDGGPLEQHVQATVVLPRAIKESPLNPAL